MTSLLDVSHSGAGNDLHGPATHPRFEGKFHILRSVSLETLIIPTQVGKKCFVDSEQASRHYWSAERFQQIFPLLLPLRSRFPLEVQRPIKGSKIKLGASSVQCHRVFVDPIDRRDGDCFRITCYPIKLSFQPACRVVSRTSVIPPIFDSTHRTSLHNGHRER